MRMRNKKETEEETMKKLFSLLLALSLLTRAVVIGGAYYAAL